ncbi:MAG TPA: hypothetical protein VI072_24685 [Polyangiaceae bacterium]
MASRRAELCSACALVFVLFGASCASTTLRVPDHDPGNARVPGAAVAEPPETLAPGFDPYESSAAPAADGADRKDSGSGHGDQSGHGHH